MSKLFGKIKKPFAQKGAGENNKTTTDQYKNLDLTVSVLEYAKVYVELGLSVIPLKPRDKKPVIKEWKPYQNNKTTNEDLEKWFKDTNNNIGIVCGVVSGNLIVIDFDGEEIYQEFALKILDSELSAKFDNTWVVKTKKGYHVYFRIDTDPETFRKVFRNKVKLVERVNQNGVTEQVDVRGEGGYVVAPPSIHPESTDDNIIHYEFIKGPSIVHEPAKITIDEWNELLKLLGANPTKDLVDALNLERQKGESQKDNTNTQQQEAAPKKEQPQQKKESGIVYSSKMTIWGDSELIEIKSLLTEAWKTGVRHYLALFLSGWFSKANIHPVSVAKLFTLIANEAKDPELEDRLSTIYYSYRKAFGGEIEELKELDQYIDKLKSDGIIRRNVSRGEGISEEHIKGKSGVQEILEDVLGEEKALEIIRRLEEILGQASPYRDSVVILTDFDSGLGYVNDVKRLRIYRCEYDEKKKAIRAAKLVWEGAITRVVMYDNPLGGITKYEITWESQARPGKPMTVSGNLEEIYDRLRIEGFLSNSRFGRDALSNIINAFIMRDKAEIKPDIDAPGFYVIDNNNKLINVKYEISEVTVNELKEALLLLNELADKWYSHIKEKFATVIKWGVISPFIYARKQLGRQYQVPHLSLYGARNTGKTTLAEIASIYLWETEGIDRVFNGNQSNTEARFGEKVKRTTFPIVINEANDVFKDSNTGLINLLKTSVEEKIARGKFTKYGYEEIPALAPVIFTLNPQPPVDFEGLMLVPKTILLIYFPEGERLPSEKIAEFRKNIEPQLPKLGAIGKFVAKAMLERGVEALKKDWRELSVELLSQAYTYSGLTPPEWLNVIYEQSSFEEIDRERKESVRSKIKKYSIELYTRNVMKIIDVRENGNEYLVEETTREIIDTLLRRGLYPFIKQEGDYLYITRVILDEIKLDVANLEDLANLLGWEYIKRKHFDDTTLSVVKVNRETFIQWLSK